MPQRFFFDCDFDSHNYLLPLEKRGEWLGLIEKIDNMELFLDGCEPYDELIKELETQFGQYKLTEDVSHFSFESPEKLDG